MISLGGCAGSQPTLHEPGRWRQEPGLLGIENCCAHARSGSSSASTSGGGSELIQADWSAASSSRWVARRVRGITGSLGHPHQQLKPALLCHPRHCGPDRRRADAERREEPDQRRDRGAAAARAQVISIKIGKSRACVHRSSVAPGAPGSPMRSRRRRPRPTGVLTRPCDYLCCSLAVGPVRRMGS